MAGVYEVIVVAMDGTPYGTLTDAKLGPITWELNGPGAASFTLATTDPDAAHAQPGREAQIWRDGDLLWWGPIVRPQVQLWETSWQCAGLLWYFGRRYMGRADRVNQLTNGDFEAGETGWTFANGVTHSIDTGIKVEGAQSEKLTGATANHLQSARQTYTHAVQYSPPGDFLTGAAWVYIPSVSYLGGAVEDRGLLLVHRNTDGEVVDVQVANIDDNTVKDAWVPLEAGVANVLEGETVEVRLYPPHGVAYYDLVTLTLMESLSFWPGEDVADIIEGIVLYAQDLGAFTHGKSDLNITVSASPTGVILNRVYQFAEHRNIGDALAEFTRNDIVDIDIAITATTRTLTTYSPRKGSLYGTTLELDTNLAGFTWSWDGNEAATNVVVLGPGDGPDRPEGGASDDTLLGGLTLEHVESAPDDALVGELDDRAAAILSIVGRPEIVEVTTYPHSAVITDVAVGDTAHILISHGYINIDAVYRVVKISVDPATDQATLTLNVI